MGYSFRLRARVLLYASSHRQDNTYHSFCYTSRGALAGTRNSSTVHSMKDRSDDPSHHERTLLSRSYISLPVFGDCFCQDLRNKKPNSVCSSNLLIGVTTSVMKVTLLLFVPWNMTLCCQQCVTFGSLCLPVTPVAGYSVAMVIFYYCQWLQDRSSDYSLKEDPLSYFSFQPVFHDWCNNGSSVHCLVCEIVLIKEPFLLI